MIAFFKTILFYPILNGVIILYNYLPPHDLGLVIIALTFLIRLALSPLSYKAARAQKKIAKIQPKIKKIQDKYKDNKEKQAQKLMEVYRKYKVNPIAGLLPLLVQLPIIISLYRVFIAVLNNNYTEGLYSFVTAPETIDPTFLNLINLGEKSLAVALIAGFLQFIHSRLISAQKSKNQKSISEVIQKGDFSFKNLTQAMGSQMALFMPLIAVVIGASLPAGLPLYWSTATLFRIGEQLLVKNNDENGKEKQGKKEEENKEKSKEDSAPEDNTEK